MFWSFELDMFGQIDNEAQVLYGCLIDGSNRIIDEAAGGQDGKCENFGIMGLILVQGTDSLGVYHNDIDGFTVVGGPLYDVSPAPQSLGARIDCRSDSESVSLVE